MEGPRTEYIQRDGAALAYQTGGSGAHEIIMYAELNVHPDLIRSDPAVHELFERASEVGRWVILQARGLGLSERVPYVPSVEQQAEDLLAVVDAVGMRRPTLMGMFSTAGAVALLAATQPARVRSLVLLQPWLTGPLADRAADSGWAGTDIDEYVAIWSGAFKDWGTGRTIDLWDPVQGTSYNRRLMGMVERCSATPALAYAFYEWAMHLDLSDVYPRVHVPTRVLRVPSSYIPEQPIRFVAERIAGAEHVVLPETPPGASMGEAFVPIFEQLLEMVTGARSTEQSHRFLGTVLFTDVVGSTELLATLGDARYRRVRADHERQVRTLVEEYDGRLINVTGDGTLSVFDGPTRAIRCAREMCAAAATLGLAIRVGVHTGELERTAMDVTGIAVHIGARVAAHARAGEVLVSRSVRDLALGSGLGFRNRGAFPLKGVPGTWELFEAVEGESISGPPLADPSTATPLDRAAVRVARHAPAIARRVIATGNALERRRARRRRPESGG